MIYGVKNWENKNIRYDQTRNAIEEIKRKILAENGIQTGHLESCGASSFCTLMEGLGYLISADYFTFPNGETIQMDDAIMIWLNDPMRGKYTDVMDNRYGDVYIDAARKCFICKANATINARFEHVTEELKNGNGVQVCLKNPGHWIALVAFDTETQNIMFMDSWGGRPGLRNGGIYETLSRPDWQNVQPTVIIYPKKGAIS